MGMAPMHVYLNGYKKWLQVHSIWLQKKNAKSVFWQYFGLEADEKNIPKQELEDQPVCRKCYK